MTHLATPPGETRSRLPVAMIARPRSATAAGVGFSGIAAALASIAMLRGSAEPVWAKSVAVMALVAVAMIAADAVTHRLAHRPWGLFTRPVRARNGLRIAQKLIGFWLTIGALAALYAWLPVYADKSFDAFKSAALACLPAVVILSPFYIAYVDRRQADPDDVYVQLSALLGGIRPRDWNDLRQHALGWIVKGFFLPLMFGFIARDLAGFWSGPLLPRFDSFEAIFSRLIDLFYFIDVLLAGVAYVLTLRLLDTHIRSTEATMSGWVVCLLCYPPFNGVTGQFLPYDQDGLYWGKVFAPYPALYAIWGSVILALVFVYMWSTAAFGLRFSNLTNRGIITNGPYRWSKHPAYVSKNLSWWLISVPFIAGAGWQQAVQSCVLLGGVNLIYVLRARTEERHLSHDPAYRDYVRLIARAGLVARILGENSRRG